MPFLHPHDYQSHALQWLIRRTIIEGHAGGALLLDPGLGKTCVTLAWIKLLKMMGLSKRVLIVAPLRVVYEVWPAEIKQWEQFHGLSISIVHGTIGQKAKRLWADADVYVTNPENLVSIQKDLKDCPEYFTTLIVDESDKFKSWGSKRTKALRKMLPFFRYRVILTGTPSPNSTEDLFAQMYIVDLGTALGRNITAFRSRYFYRGGYGGYKWLPHQNAQKIIEGKIAPMCLRLSAEDNLDLPDLLIHDVWINLPSDVMKNYKKLERDLFLALASGDRLTAVNAGAKYMMCRQLANGGIYSEGEAVNVHNAKITAIKDMVDELQGKPVLIAFQFRHDLDRLRQVWPGLPSIDGRCKPRDASRYIEQWNAGELPLLAAQPMSLSHGVNMQKGPGRDVIWLGLTDNLITYLQLNARIYRQGVTSNVRVHRILAHGTVDEAIRGYIETKDENQRSLLNALNSYRKNQ